jgi:CPA2 family monovalent cation:H+ antiporter-2
MVNTAQTLNPEIEIVLRSGNEDEAALLKKDNLGTVFYSTEELAKNIMQHVLQRFDR